MNDLALADAGLAVFEGRVILEAQPPVSAAEIARLEAGLVGPVPPDLVALWNICYGGRIDYDLDVAFGEHIHRFGCTELFYPRSQGYHDLDGWIAHERELLAESNERTARDSRAPKLEFLPFGGFEYLDRLYVRVGDDDYGAVYAYSEGIPPAWSLQLHENSVARVADSVRALFRLLYLERDPFTAAPDSYTHGMEARRAIATACAEGKLGASDASALEAILASAIANWRAALAAGTLANNRRLVRLALEHTAETGDLDLLQQLEQQGIDLARPLAGRGSLLDHSLMCGQVGLANALLDRGLRAGDQTLQCAPDDAAAALLQRLRDAGAKANEDAVLKAVYAGRFDNAELMARWFLQDDPDARKLLRTSCNEYARSNEESARRIEQGQMESNLTPADYREEARRLREFASRLAAL